MISNSPYRSAAVWLAPGVFMLLILATELLGDRGRELLAYERAAILDGQWWRLLSGNFVHLGGYHWMLNTVGLLVLVLLCPQALPMYVWLRRVLLLSLGVGLGLLLFVPGLTSYVGMSGVIHGLFVLGLVPQALRRDLIALGCLLYLLGKIAWELYAGAPLSDEAAIGGRVVVESHLFGTLSAFVYGLVFGSFTGREGRRRSPPPPQESQDQT